jgi:hypothetical protein
MLKPIILVHSIENEKKDAAVFADLQVGDLRKEQDRMGKDELFDSATMKKLQEWGLVVNNEGGHFGENQFLQLTNNPRMISAIKHAIINANLFRAETALNLPDEKTRKILIPKLGEPLHTDTISRVYLYYASTDLGKPILVRPDVIDKGTKDDSWVEYHPEEHGYLPLGNICIGKTMHYKGPYNSDNPTQNKLEAPFTNLNLNPFRVFGLPRHKGQTRSVDVRGGNSHHFEWSDLTPCDPVDGKRYHIQYWK